MKAHHLAAASLLAVLTFPATLHAQMMGPGGPISGPWSTSASPLARGPYMGSIDMRNVASAWLDGLHDALAITPAQEQAWLAFANAVTDQAADMQAFRTRIVQSSAGTAPQRAALAEQFLAQRLESVGAVASSMAALYGELTPAQRAVLDRGFASACYPGGLFGS